MNNVITMTTETSRRLSNRLVSETARNKAHVALIQYERDEAEKSFMEVYELVTGKPCQFSHTYGYPQAISDIRKSLCSYLQIVDTTVTRK